MTARHPMFSCGRCRKPHSAWSRGKLCRGCQRDARREIELNPVESVRDFRKRVIEPMRQRERERRDEANE